MNKASYIGNLTEDPELKSTSSGKSVCRFTLAVKRNYKDQSGEYLSDFIPCVAWGNIGEIIAKYVKKGHKLGVTGRMESRKYNDRDGNSRTVIECVVEDKDFLTSRSDNDGDSNKSASSDYHRPPAQQPRGNDDDDLPF